MSARKHTIILFVADSAFTVSTKAGVSMLSGSALSFLSTLLIGKDQHTYTWNKNKPLRMSKAFMTIKL